MELHNARPFPLLAAAADYAPPSCRRQSQLPTHWQRAPSSAWMAERARDLGLPVEEIIYSVAVTMPASELAFSYQQWATLQPSDTDDPNLAVMVENTGDWLAHYGEEGLREMRESFRQFGRPCHFSSAVGRRPDSPGTGTSLSSQPRHQRRAEGRAQRTEARRNDKRQQ